MRTNSGPTFSGSAPRLRSGPWRIEFRLSPNHRIRAKCTPNARIFSLSIGLYATRLIKPRDRFLSPSRRAMPSGEKCLSCGRCQSEKPLTQSPAQTVKSPVIAVLADIANSIRSSAAMLQLYWEAFVYIDKLVCEICATSKRSDTTCGAIISTR